MKTSEAILHEGDALDAWMQRQVSRRIAPLLRRAAQEIGRTAQTQGPQATLRRWEVAMKEQVQPRIERLAREAITRAVRRAGTAFESVVIAEYGQRHAARLLRMHGAGAEDVIQRITELPDRFGYTYSDRVWSNLTVVRQELERFMTRHVRESASLIQEAKALVAYQLDDHTLPRHMQALERLGRRVMADVPGDKTAFLQALKRARAYIEGLTPGERGTQGFQRRTVRQIEQAVQRGSVHALETAIEIFVQKRAEYRARVLLRTEVNRAYGEGVLDTYRQRNFVQAVRWILNPRHAQVDECDAKAKANISLGPGVYYKDAVPWPSHTNCLCRLTPVMAPFAESLTATPFQPQDRSMLERVMEHIRGPLARQADRLGQALRTAGKWVGLFGATEPQTLQTLLRDIPKVPPLSSPSSPSSLPSLPAIEAFVAHFRRATYTLQQRLLDQLAERVRDGKGMQIPDGPWLTPIETAQLYEILIRLC